MRLVLLILLFAVSCRKPARELPSINTSGFEPLIVAQIERATAEVRAAPGSGAAWGRLGMVLHAYELELEASQCYEHAESLDPKESRWPALHAVLLRQQDLPAATKRLERAARLGAFPDALLAEVTSLRIGLKAWSDQASQLLAKGKHADAAPLIDRLAKTYPDAPETWVLLGQWRLGQNDCAGAGQAMRELLKRSPDSVNGRMHLARALLCLERYAEAVGILQRAIQLKPDLGEAHFNLGFALARSGNGHAAIPSFRNAIRYNPGFIDPYITLADLLSQTGQTQEAIALLHRALQLNPADTRAQSLLRRLQR